MLSLGALSSKNITFQLSHIFIHLPSYPHAIHIFNKKDNYSDLKDIFYCHGPKVKMCPFAHEFSSSCGICLLLILHF